MVQVEQPDWEFASNPIVVEVAEAAAKTISRDFARSIEYADALQEAFIILATKATAAREALAKGEGVLHRMLWQDLADKVKTEHKHRRNHISHDVMKGAVLAAEEARV